MTNVGVHAEGCSNAIMEYMACGLPVVCSDSGGSAELVRDGRDGYVIAPHDAARTLARRVAEAAGTIPSYGGQWALPAGQGSRRTSARNAW